MGGSPEHEHRRGALVGPRVIADRLHGREDGAEVGAVGAVAPEVLRAALLVDGGEGVLAGDHVGGELAGAGGAGDLARRRRPRARLVRRGGRSPSGWSPPPRCSRGPLPEGFEGGLVVVAVAVGGVGETGDGEPCRRCGAFEAAEPDVGGRGHLPRWGGSRPGPGRSRGPVRPRGWPRRGRRQAVRRGPCLPVQDRASVTESKQNMTLCKVLFTVSPRRTHESGTDPSPADAETGSVIGSATRAAARASSFIPQPSSTPRDSSSPAFATPTRRWALAVGLPGPADSMAAARTSWASGGEGQVPAVNLGARRGDARAGCRGRGRAGPGLRSAPGGIALGDGAREDVPRRDRLLVFARGRGGGAVQRVDGVFGQIDGHAGICACGLRVVSRPGRSAVPAPSEPGHHARAKVSPRRIPGTWRPVLDSPELHLHVRPRNRTRSAVTSVSSLGQRLQPDPSKPRLSADSMSQPARAAQRCTDSSAPG